MMSSFKTASLKMAMLDLLVEECIILCSVDFAGHTTVINSTSLHHVMAQEVEFIHIGYVEEPLFICF